MPPVSGPVRFGDFAFDPSSGELDGPAGRVRLQPQVAALLVVLLERAGDVVLRTELHARLWPSTTVDFDEGLNFAVRQLRLALGDEPSSPRYVETLPRRGYRFVAPVEPLQSPAAAEPATVDVRSALPPLEAPSRKARNWRRILSRAAAALVFLLVAALALQRRVSRVSESLSARPALGVGSFSVDTTDPLMVRYHDRLMEELLSRAGAERQWSIVPADSATHVLSGTLTRQGNSVAIFVQLVVRRDGRHLWADNILDTYPFAGNSTLMGDRIEASVARILAR